MSVLRRWIRSPGVTLGIVLSAMVGVAVATLGVTYPLNILFPPVPYDVGNRLVVFDEAGLNSVEYADREGSVLDISRDVLADLRTHTDVFETVIAYSENTSIMLRDAPGTSNVGHGIPHDLFPRLGIKPFLGRFFTAEEDQPGRGQVIVLGHRWWRTRFGGDPDIVGKVIHTNSLYGDGDYTVIGVAESDKVFPPQWGSEFYVPLGSHTLRRWRAGHWTSALAIVRPGVSRARVRTVAEAAAARHGEADRDVMRSYRNEGRMYQAQKQPVRVVASTFRRPPVRYSGEMSQAALLVGLGLAILLIASLNIAGLSLARMVSRRSELAVRAALGASRRRLLTALIGETVAVTAVGAVIGLAGTAAFMMWARGASDPELANRFAIDWRVGSVALGVTMLAALIAVLWPAVQLGRADLSLMVKSNHGSWRGGTAGGFRRVIAMQVALTVMLCVCAAAFIGAIGRYLRTDRGFVPEHAFIVSVSTPESEAGRVGAMQTAIDAISAIPGVDAVGVGSIPVRGRFTLDFGVSATPGGPVRGMQAVLPVAGDYFRALGIQLIAGRAITAAEARDGARVAVVGSSMRRELWPAGDAVGKRVYFGEDAATAVSYEVVGIARDITMPFPRPLPQVYVPYATRSPRVTSIVARVSGEPGAAMRAAQSVLGNPTLSLDVRDVSTLTAAVRRGASAQIYFATLLSILAFIGLVMAAAGLYGVTAYTTGQRMREFGIRLALGASPRRLLVFTLREASQPVVSGLVIGLAAGVALAMTLRSMLLGVSPADPRVLGGVSALVLVVAAAAALHPALRVARTDPATPLRSE